MAAKLSSPFAGGKRYRTFNSYLREIFGCRVHKVSLDAGFTCPNRDGTCGTGGCIYCDNDGFSYNTARGPAPLAEQLEAGLHHMRRRFGAEKFIAYFQAFSSTYAPPDRLKETYDIIRRYPEIVGLFVSTRPDCLDEAALALLASYREQYLTWLELGLQSASDSTLKRINRGHSVADFREAVSRAADHGLPVCAHVILGLPGESEKEMLATAGLLAGLKVQGVKIHLLHILTGTLLAKQFAEQPFHLLGPEEYAGLAADFLERLPPGVVVQRVAVDVPRDRLVGPVWCADKRAAVAAVDRELERRGSCQGALFGDAP